MSSNAEGLHSLSPDIVGGEGWGEGAGVQLAQTYQQRLPLPAALSPIASAGREGYFLFARWTRMPTRHFALTLLGIALTLSASVARAKHMYQYTDSKGIVHFTDVK